MRPPRHDVLADLTLEGLYRELTGGGLAGRLFELARDEDLGPHGLDVTSGITLEAGERVAAHLRAREAGVVSGLVSLPELCDVFASEAGRVEFETHARDGEPIEPGQTLATLTGPTRAVVRLERTMLNLISRMSGVATRTRRFASAIPDGTRAKLYDTRKTTPGWRAFEKYAVRCGGGSTHRIGLYDAVLLKDNHLASLSVGELRARLEAGARRARAEHELRFFEVEVDTLEQLDAVLGVESGLIDVVMLDNFSVEDLRRGVERRNETGAVVELEASGGVTLDTIGTIATTGVERISVGSLTHHAVSLDLGLDIEPVDR
ncbi:MAG: carboxylating nicotinate-nucleotide diphosphorylase [Phycisphaerales bacterium JB059]